MDFVPPDPDYAAKVRKSFGTQPAMSLLFRATMDRVAPDYVEISLPARPELLQQHGNLHGGIACALADSACGYAALTLMAAASEVVTVELKMNYLAPGFGELFVARGRVLKAGRTLTVCVGEVFAIQAGVEKRFAYMTTTMMAVADKQS